MIAITFDPDFACAADYAKLYRQLGLQAVPSYSPLEAPNWKRPSLSAWKEFESTPVPESQFDKWFGWEGSHKTKTNIGLITGACSGGAFILDVDSHKHPEAQEWLMNLLDAYNDGNRLNCPVQQTGGGGFQYLLRAPEGWTPPTIKTPIGIDIRGQGGFAVMPPSLHDSGGEYKWLKGSEPWVIDIPVAEGWLTAEIDQLVQKYGAAKNLGNFNTENGSNLAQTQTPQYAKTEFGQIVDGREEYMTKIVFAKVLSLYRESPILPSAERLQDAMREAFATYERNVKSRIQERGTPNHILLEREGRGITEFNKKWQYLLNQWHTKVAEAAAQPIHKIEGDLDGALTNDNYPNFEKLDEIRDSIAADLAAGPEAIDRAKAPEWIVSNILPVAGANLAGTGGTGKTTLILNEYIRIVNCMDLYGMQVNRPGVCILVTAEDGPNHPRYVLQRVLSSGLECEAITIHQSNAAKNLIKVVGWDRSKFGPIATVDSKGGLNRAYSFELLIDMLEPYKASVITLDPAALFSPGERFGNDGEAFIASMIHEAALRLRCHIQMLDHVSQEAARSGAIHQHAARGGTAKTDNARMARQLVAYRIDNSNKRDSNNIPPSEITQHDVAEGRVLQLHWTKSNYGPKPAMVWLKREGFWYWHKENPSPEQAKLMRECRQKQRDEDEERMVISTVKSLLEKGSFPSKTSLESVVFNDRGKEITRQNTRNAINRCLNKYLLIESDLPKNLVQGRRKFFLNIPNGH